MLLLFSLLARCRVQIMAEGRKEAFATRLVEATRDSLLERIARAAESGSWAIFTG